MKISLYIFSSILGKNEGNFGRDNKSKSPPCSSFSNVGLGAGVSVEVVTLPHRKFLMISVLAKLQKVR